MDLGAVVMDLLRPEVDAEVGRVDDPLLLGRRRPPQRRPQPREELVHRERLGHVVVGARVEGGDLDRLRVARRQHDDRHGAPAPERGRDADAVHVGETEVEDDDVGMLARGEVETFASRRREHDGVVVCLQEDAQRPPQRRFVFDHEDLAHDHAPSVPDSANAKVMVVPPPGVSSSCSSPPIASVNPRATARPRPTPAPPGPRASPRRWNG